MSASTWAPDLDAGAETNRAWHERFTKQEIQDLLRVSAWRGGVSIALNWALVAAALALVAVWPNPITVIVALFVIGARQLGMAVIMHEASHRTLLRSRRLNDWAGNWLAAYPVWSDIYPYRPYHLQHHAKNWTAEDPDIGLVKPFPITRSSLRRKIWRDLSGQTGIKFARGGWNRSVARWRSGDPVGRQAFVGFLTTNLALFGVLWACGHPALYLLWVAAWLTTNTLVTRIRAIAEHAMAEDPSNPLKNARTTLVRWWERLLMAPNYVNYHLEHHLLMTVPHYNLPRMHQMLAERGLLDGANLTRGYRAVLERASSRPETSARDGAAPSAEAEPGEPQRLPPF